MEYVKKRSILFVAILVLSMVLGSISIVSAASLDWKAGSTTPT